MRPRFWYIYRSLPAQYHPVIMLKVGLSRNKSTRRNAVLNHCLLLRLKFKRTKIGIVILYFVLGSLLLEIHFRNLSLQAGATTIKFTVLSSLSIDYYRLGERDSRLKFCLEGSTTTEDHGIALKGIAGMSESPLKVR